MIRGRFARRRSCHCRASWWDPVLVLWRFALGALVPTVRVVPRRVRERDRDGSSPLPFVSLPLSLSFSFTVPATIQPGRGSITARRRCETQRTWKTKDRTRQTRHAVGSVVAPRARVYGFEREVSVRRLTFTARQLIPREGLRVSRGGVDSLALCQHAPGRQEARSRAQRHTHVAARANE